jgi:hypothetical protein
MRGSRRRILGSETRSSPQESSFTFRRRLDPGLSHRQITLQSWQRSGQLQDREKWQQASRFPSSPSQVAWGPKSVALFPENTNEIKTLRIGPWIRDRILLIDLGFFKYQIFTWIKENGGCFVSRLKSNAWVIG